MKTIGLTGGIGSGKTTVARILSALGASVIHADQVGHEVYAPGTPGWQRVVDAFGVDILDDAKAIDRRKLGARVFADRAELERLNAIVHPLIKETIEGRIAAFRSMPDCLGVVVEAAILIEAGWQSLVDEIWLVVASHDAVVSRLKEQRNLPACDIEARLAAQLSDEERRRHAGVIIENTGSPEELRATVQAAWRRFLSRS